DRVDEIAGGELRQEVVHGLQDVERRLLAARRDQLGHVVGWLAKYVLDLAALFLELLGDVGVDDIAPLAAECSDPDGHAVELAGNGGARDGRGRKRGSETGDERFD